MGNIKSKRNRPSNAYQNAIVESDTRPRRTRFGLGRMQLRIQSNKIRNKHKMNYRNLKPNQKIRFKIPNGQRLDFKTGQIIQEYKTVSAKVNPLLIFEDHIVANYGVFGTVVDDSNFVG